MKNEQMKLEVKHIAPPKLRIRNNAEDYFYLHIDKDWNKLLMEKNTLKPNATSLLQDCCFEANEAFRENFKLDLKPVNGETVFVEKL